MINFNLFEFVACLKLIKQERRIATERAISQPNTLISADDRNRAADNLKHGIAPILRMLLLANERLGRLYTNFRQKITYEQLAYEFAVLLEQIEDECQFERFYHYPRDKGLLVLRVPGDWAATLKAFPNAEEDIKAAVDCYALGHNHASIYHSMAVLESGLPALAKQFGVEVRPNRSTWGPLIDNTREAISKELDKVAKPPKGTAPLPPKASAKRRALLEDAQEAALDLRFFKNVWRDHISHGRADYDANDAKKALDHVRSFMEIISTKLKLRPVKIT